MKLKPLLAAISLLIIGTLTFIGGTAWSDSQRDSISLKSHASELIEKGQGPASLGSSRLEWLLQVEDPLFYEHSGIDFKSPGQGTTTITQALAKRTAFANFEPGIKKFRQTIYAMGLENTMTKEEILTLFMATVPMGKCEGKWVSGLHSASEHCLGQPIESISDTQFLNLVAVMIAPARLEIRNPNTERKDRVSRIQALVDGTCQAKGWRDVWLEGCKSEPFES